MGVKHDISVYIQDLSEEGATKTNWTKEGSDRRMKTTQRQAV
jgi:hypothetical protein